MNVRAKTKQEFLDLINQALDEVFELRASVEHNEDSMGDTLPIIERLEAELNDVKTAVSAENYVFGSGAELPFMELVNNADNRLLPFKDLLSVINNTHNLGLDADGG